jgi:AI-2 transport protein TqsA
MNISSSSVPGRILVYSTFAVIVTLGMRELAPILTTFFISIFAALIFIPRIRWLKHKGIPGGVSVLLVILLFVLIVVILGVIVVKAAIQFESQIPIYQMNLLGFVDTLTNYIPSQEDLSVNSTLRSIASLMISLMKSSINGLVNAGTTAGLIVFTTAFLLIDAANTPEKTNSELEQQSEIQKRMSSLGKHVVGFLTIRAETNLITAIGVTGFFLLGGIDYAILWGVLIFLLSYVPYIGLVIASIPPAMLALFKYGPVGALAVFVIIAVVNMLAENVVFPSLAGKSLKLSPAFLFIALIYWSYVLGTVGVLLSIPLTIFLKLLLESFDDTKWLARLIGPPDVWESEKADSGENKTV